jgi:uncharacterized protein (DUF39 family)
MPVNTRRFISKTVEDMNDESIALVDLQNRKRPCVIDTNHFSSLHAVRIRHDPCHVEVFFYDCSLTCCKQYGEAKQELNDAACHGSEM